MLAFLRKMFSKGSCKDCGWWVACDACSQRFDEIDKQLDIK